MTTVTFDSNVWQPACDPNRALQEPQHSEFVLINQCLADGRVIGRLSETVFTLEGIRRVDRQVFLAGYHMRTRVVEEETPDGPRVAFSAGPDPRAHPGNNPPLETHLRNALALGFQLMRCPRIGGIQNPDLRDEWFVRSDGSEAHARLNRFMEVLRRVEAAGAGISRVKEIGARYADHSRWMDGIRRAPATEEVSISEAIAEWADGDSIAAHVGYGNDLFCTNDRAVNAGPASVLSAQNRDWLARDYGVQFVSSSELSQRLA